MSINNVTVLKSFYSNAKQADYVLGKDEYGSLKLYKGKLGEPLKLQETKNVYTAGPTKWIARKHFDNEGKEIAYSFVSRFATENGKSRYEISLHDKSLNMKKGFLNVLHTFDDRLHSTFKKYKSCNGKATLNVLDKENLTPLAKRVLNLLRK